MASPQFSTRTIFVWMYRILQGNPPPPPRAEATTCVRQLHQHSAKEDSGKPSLPWQSLRLFWAGGGQNGEGEDLQWVRQNQEGAECGH